jgi:hypothetical protein
MKNAMQTHIAALAVFVVLAAYIALSLAQPLAVIAAAR